MNAAAADVCPVPPAAIGVASYVTVLALVITGTVFVDGAAPYATPLTLATVGDGYEPLKSPDAVPFGGNAAGVPESEAYGSVPVTSVLRFTDPHDGVVPE